MEIEREGEGEQGENIKHSGGGGKTRDNGIEETQQDVLRTLGQHAERGEGTQEYEE